MLIIKRIIAFILGFLVMLSTSSSVMYFTDGEPIIAEKREYCFDDDKLLIGGYLFNRDDCTDQQFEYLRDAGIDFLVTYPNNELLDKCQEYGIGVIGISHSLPANCNYTEYKSYWTEFDGSSYNDHPALWGDLMIDEPNSVCFDDLAQMLEVYYNNPKTANKMPYINLFPQYAPIELLGETLGENSRRDTANNLFFGDLKFNPVGKYQTRLADLGDKEIEAFKMYISDYINTIDTDYISVDIYPLKKNDVTYGGWLRGLDVVSEACRKTGRRLIVITQAAGNKDGDPESNNRFANTFEDINWQSMISLSFGAKVIAHGCYYSGNINGNYMGWWDQDSHCIDANGNRTDTYYAVKRSNEFLRTFDEVYMGYNNMGAFLTKISGENEGCRTGYLAPVDGDPKCSVSSNDNVLVGCFEKDNERAYTFVNLESTKTDDTATFTASFDGEKEITIYSSAGIKTINASSFTYTLSTQEGIFVTVK